jgi:HlyD family secretion protein
VVFCVEENHAVAKQVELGISDDQFYEIKSGLGDGELVITGPFRLLSRNLKEGDLVEYKEPKKEEKNVN